MDLANHAFSLLDTFFFMYLKMTDCLLSPSSSEDTCYTKQDRNKLHKVYPQIAVDMSDHEIRDELIEKINALDSMRKGSKSTQFLRHYAMDVVKPKPSEHPKKWLSNTNIYAVLYPYFRQHRDQVTFHKMSLHDEPPLPSTKNKSHSAIDTWVIWYNSHWVGVWMDHERQLYYYFNSEGPDRKLPKHLKQAKTWCQKQHYRFVRNKTTFQKKPGECGMFVIYFMLYCLSGRDPLALDSNEEVKQVLTDAGMKQMRSSIFASK
jgi:hypothetical protein